MCRPATSRHKVSGVGRTRPTGPQSELQNMAPTTTESDDKPVAWPYRRGSSNGAAMMSSPMKSANVLAASDHPGSTANDIAVANSAAMATPTYGTKRMTPASAPHSMACGTPRSPRPAQISTPNTRLTADCETKYRDSRSPASL